MHLEDDFGLRWTEEEQREAEKALRHGTLYGTGLMRMSLPRRPGKSTLYPSAYRALVAREEVSPLLLDLSQTTTRFTSIAPKEPRQMTVKHAAIRCDLSRNFSLEINPSQARDKALLAIHGGTSGHKGIRLTPETARVLIDALETIATPKAAQASIPMTASNVPARLRDAAEFILGGIDWNRSKEGSEFWDKAYCGLYRIAKDLEKPPLTSADFTSPKVPAGYQTIAGFLFGYGGAERALSEEGSAAGRKLVSKLRHAGDPLVQVAAPKAVVDATNGKVTRVFAYPLGVLETFFKVAPAAKVVPFGNATIRNAQGKNFPVGTRVYAKRGFGAYGDGFHVRSAAGHNTWVYPTSIDLD